MQFWLTWARLLADQPAQRRVQAWQNKRNFHFNNFFSRRNYFPYEILTLLPDMERARVDQQALVQAPDALL